MRVHVVTRDRKLAEDETESCQGRLNLSVKEIDELKGFRGVDTVRDEGILRIFYLSIKLASI